MLTLLFPTLCLTASLPPSLQDLERKAVEYFVHQSNPATGFTKDRAADFASSDAYTVSSCAATGFALIAYAIGSKNGWIPRSKALVRSRLALSAMLNGWPQDHGWLYHFADWRTGARMWKSEVSTIDTAIFLAGALISDQYWNDRAYHGLVRRFINRIDWRWMQVDRQGDSSEYYDMAWTPEHSYVASQWSSFSEFAILYVESAGITGAGRRGWDDAKRDEFGPIGAQYLAGGPLFMHQMPATLIDFRNRRDAGGYDYNVEAKNFTLAALGFANDNPKHWLESGPGYWGLSACDTPTGYTAYGLPPWNPGDGTIAPSSAVASVQFDPTAAKEFLRRFYRSHPDAFGRYGLCNGYDSMAKWRDPDAIGIDLGIAMCSIENDRTGWVLRESDACPIFRKGLAVLGFHTDPGADSGPLRDSSH